MLNASIDVEHKITDTVRPPGASGGDRREGKRGKGREKINLNDSTRNLSKLFKRKKKKRYIFLDDRY